MLIFSDIPDTGFEIIDHTYLSNEEDLGFNTRLWHMSSIILIKIKIKNYNHAADICARFVQFS